MGFTIGQVEEHLVGMGHGGTLKKVRNPYAMYERAANSVLGRVRILETERTVALAQTIHDDQFNYSLPTDYDKPIDLIPQDNRGLLDNANRIGANEFDLKKGLADKTISIESSEGLKFLRVNWRWRGAKTLNSNDSLTGNGTWAIVGSASSLVADSIYKMSGSASLRFNVAASGDGIQNTTMSQVDLTSENGVGDFYVPVYLPTITGLTSVGFVFGNDLTTKYWTCVNQTTQADGTALRVGWNILKFSWATATQTGIVVPTQIDSAKVVFVVTTAIANIRVDNITVSIGRPFDLKYYSKYLFTVNGVWSSRPADSDSIVVCDNDSLNIFLYESLISMAHQVEGTDSAFDINFALKELNDPERGLYQKYRAEHPSMSKKQVGRLSSGPRWGWRK